MKKLFILLTLFLFCSFCFSQSRYISETTKKIVYARDNGKCQCCGSYQNLEYDHIIPYSCGGSNKASNIQLLCQKCNRSKSNSCYCKVHNKKVGNDCCDGKSNVRKSEISSYSTKKTSETSSQCTGITKKGARCKKMTKNPSGRCHLH
jgi:hypothetical protein